MGRLKAWLDWSVLALCVAAAAGAVAYGIRTLDAWPQTHAAGGRPAPAGFAVIAGLAAVNCGFLLGAAAGKAWQEVGLRGARRR